jgi:hypothetical protein
MESEQNERLPTTSIWNCELGFCRELRDVLATGHEKHLYDAFCGVVHKMCKPTCGAS